MTALIALGNLKSTENTHASTHINLHNKFIEQLFSNSCFNCEICFKNKKEEENSFAFSEDINKISDVLEKKEEVLSAIVGQKNLKIISTSKIYLQYDLVTKNLTKTFILKTDTNTLFKVEALNGQNILINGKILVLTIEENGKFFWKKQANIYDITKEQIIIQLKSFLEQLNKTNSINLDVSTLLNSYKEDINILSQKIVLHLNIPFNKKEFLVDVEKLKKLNITLILNFQNSTSDISVIVKLWKTSNKFQYNLSNSGITSLIDIENISITQLAIYSSCEIKLQQLDVDTVTFINQVNITKKMSIVPEKIRDKIPGTDQVFPCNIKIKDYGHFLECKTC